MLTFVTGPTVGKTYGESVHKDFSSTICAEAKALPSPMLFRHFNHSTHGNTAQLASIILAPIFSFALILAPKALAQPLNQGQVTASYLYNFAKNIRWPNASDTQEFSIALYRTEDRQLIDALALLQKDIKLDGKPIRVQQVNTVAALAKHQMVYIERPNKELITGIYGVIDSKPVLLVTSEHQDQQVVMINLIRTQEKRLRFEVNMSNLIYQGLTALPELILNGGSEIDVAKLYREGQASLVTMQKQLSAREANLNKLASQIAQQEQRNQQLNQRLETLNQQIKDSAGVIESQIQTIEQQKAAIKSSQQEREALVKEVQRRTRALEQQKKIFQESQQRLYQIREEIERRGKRLASLNTTIKQQEQQINTQKEEIVELDELVSSQERAMVYLRVMVFLGLLLAVTILGAYHIKRKDNIRLEAHGKDLQRAKDKLDIAKRKAEDANQAKSAFLSLMSHELRTPLQAILGYTHVVIEDLENDGDDQHAEDLTRVVDNSERLLKLINGVLDLAKIEAGRMELHLDEVDLDDITDKALNAVRPQFAKAHNQLETDIQTTSPQPIADGEKLLHIMINLLSNAAKFTKNGIVSIHVSNNEEHLYIKVRDTGIGMTKEQQKTIFNQFQQVDNKTTRKFEGTGLGLSITRQFCQLMGGKIDVDSEQGVGSLFTVFIPLPISDSDDD